MAPQKRAVAFSQATHTDRGGGATLPNAPPCQDDPPIRGRDRRGKRYVLLGGLPERLSRACVERREDPKQPRPRLPHIEDPIQQLVWGPAIAEMLGQPTFPHQSARIGAISRGG